MLSVLTPKPQNPKQTTTGPEGNLGRDEADGGDGFVGVDAHQNSSNCAR